jgi:hypothetical protein
VGLGDVLCQRYLCRERSSFLPRYDEDVIGQRKLGYAMGGQEVEVNVECEGEEVTGSCLNEKCLYHVGSCFE